MALVASKADAFSDPIQCRARNSSGARSARVQDILYIIWARAQIHIALPRLGEPRIHQFIQFLLRVPISKTTRTVSLRKIRDLLR